LKASTPASETPSSETIYGLFQINDKRPSDKTGLAAFLAVAIPTDFCPDEEILDSGDDESWYWRSL
jgi:hypothetical protein